MRILSRRQVLEWLSLRSVSRRLRTRFVCMPTGARSAPACGTEIKLDD